MNLVSFTSDFGLRDNYVGVVKGVMLSINPNLQVIDLSHEIAPFAVAQAAYTLSTACNYFPEGTVHLVVVDPGVGTDRLPLILHTPKYDFIGPDNGIFSHIPDNKSLKNYVIRRDRIHSFYKIHPEAGSTFDGRDLFGPAAALISKGIKPEEIADPLEDMPVLLSDMLSPEYGWQYIDVMHVDHFGNMITALHRSYLKDKMTLRYVKIRDRLIETVSDCYQKVQIGELLAVWGSSGYLEISVNQGNAAKLLNYSSGKNLLEVFIE